MADLRGLGAASAARRAATDLIVGTSKVGTLQKPISIQFPVNDTCNSACQMCNIWRQSERHPISPGELDDLLRSDLFDHVRTVGLNGGEPTLRKDLAELAGVVAARLPRLQKIAVITNALHPPTVLRRLREVRETLRPTEVALDIMVSLDGWGEAHDLVRGKPGNFEAALEVIDTIQTEDLADHLRLGATIIDDNVTEIEELRFQVARRSLPINFRVGVPHRRLYIDPGEPFALSRQQRDHLLRFLADLSASAPELDQRSTYRSIVDQIAYGRDRAVGCDFQGRAITLTSRRELALCPVVGGTIGKAERATCSDDYYGAQAELDSIMEQHCASCVHDYRGPRSRSATLRFGAEVTGLAQVAITARERLRSGGRTRDTILATAARLDDVRSVRVATPRPADPTGSTLIIGWWGTETLGDQAILGGVASALGEAGVADDSVHVVSTEPFLSHETTHAIGRPDWHVTTPESARDDLLQGRVARVLVGGGPLLSIRPLKQLESLLVLARRAGASTGLVGCGIGPLRGTWSERSVEQILRASDFVGLRDAASVDWASRRGIDATDIGDPATWYLTDRRPLGDDRSGRVVALREPDPLYAERAALDDLAPFVDRAASALDELGGPFEPLPMHSYHVGGDDRWFLRELSERCDHLPFHWRRRTLDEAIELVSGAELLVAGRYHAVVFGAALGVPTVAVDYSGPNGKISSFSAAYGLGVCRIDAWSTRLAVAAAAEQTTTIDWSAVADQIAERATVGRQTFVDRLS